MKIAVAVASERALPSAFVVLRGIEESIRRAAELGYDGVELALRDGREIKASKVKELTREFGLEVPAVSTGQLFADQRLWLSARDPSVRERAAEEINRIIDVAAELDAVVNIGRVRGYMECGDTIDETIKRFASAMVGVSEYAQRAGVELVLEPVNRYESNFINNLQEGAELIDRLGLENLKFMPDVFHMNIEDASIEDSFKKYRDLIRYVHLSDSNRLAPGWGHLDFESIVDVLKEIDYNDWISVEILPKPNPDLAALQAITYLRHLIPKCV